MEESEASLPTAQQILGALVFYRNLEQDINHIRSRLAALTSTYLKVNRLGAPEQFVWVKPGPDVKYYISTLTQSVYNNGYLDFLIRGYPGEGLEKLALQIVRERNLEFCACAEFVADHRTLSGQAWITLRIKVLVRCLSIIGNHNGAGVVRVGGYHFLIANSAVNFEVFDKVLAIENIIIDTQYLDEAAPFLLFAEEGATKLKHVKQLLVELEEIYGGQGDAGGQRHD